MVSKRAAASLANNGDGPRISLTPSDDLSEASSHRVGRIVGFRKILPTKFIVRSMPNA
jgi:hypothetical protein